MNSAPLTPVNPTIDEIVIVALPVVLTENNVDTLYEFVPAPALNICPSMFPAEPLTLPAVAKVNDPAVNVARLALMLACTT